MPHRSVQLLRRLVLILTFMASLLAPAALAQEVATPAAVAPPQALLPTPAAERQGQTTTINGVELFYEVVGEGQPLVLLHSSVGHGGYWAQQVPAFAAHYQVIVLDTRGHGRSSFADMPYSYALLASDVIGLLDHLGIEQANVVGWSDGGTTTLELAIHHPERVRKAVIYAATYDLSGFLPDALSHPRVLAYIAQAARDYQQLSPVPEHWEALLSRLSEMWAREPAYTPEQLRAITTPILILDGEEEEAVNLEHTRQMAELIPTATLVLLPGTGHFAPFEQPARFTQIVLDFLDS